MEEGATLPDFEIEDRDLDWLALTEGAAEAFCDEEPDTALDRWRQAAEMAKAFSDGDPRRACSESNLGLAALIGGNTVAARDAFESAESAWGEARERVAEMALQPRARSSLFHMRLEREHRQRYDLPVRNHHRRAVERGRAATLMNLAACADQRGERSEVVAAYDRALEAGAKAAALAEDLLPLIETARRQSDRTPSTGDRIYYQPFASQAGEERWLIDIPPVMTDEGRLMAAVRLTAVWIGAK